MSPRTDIKRSRFERISWWRFPAESRVVAWALMGLVLAGLAVAVAMGVTITVGHHHCVEACAERQYLSREYTAASRSGTKPAVCTCCSDGAPVEVPMQ